MLNAVRKCALRARVLNVHWLHALVPATSIVSSAPSSRRDAKSTAYDTDIVEPPEASGRFTLNAEASDEQSSRTMKRRQVVDSAREEVDDDRCAGDDDGGHVYAGGERKVLHTTRLEFFGAVPRSPAGEAGEALVMLLSF